MKHFLPSYSKTLNRYASLYQIQIGILDDSGQLLLAAKWPANMACFTQYKECLDQVIPVSFDNGKYWLTSKLLSLDESEYYYLAVLSPVSDNLIFKCISISVTLEELLSSAPSDSAQVTLQHKDSHQRQLALLLLAQKAPLERILSLMNTLELDETLLRCVILIRLGFSTNKYFNINLNLGYQPILEKLRDEAFQIVRNCRYLTTQDICSFTNENEIVVFKSFVAGSDLSRVYLALDRICENIEQGLASIALLNVKIAYGNIYQDISQLYQSHAEATEILALGAKVLPDIDFYNIENIMMDIICQFLHPQITNKILLPRLKALIGDDGLIQTTLMNCAEIFVDSCLNYSLASQTAQIHRNTLNNRLARFSDLTHLKPHENFRDALITKLMAVYYRQNPNLRN